MPEYANDTYLQSLATARAGIDRNVANTLTEVTRQRELGVNQAKLVPGAVTGTNTAAATQSSVATGDMMGSLEKYGFAHPDLGMRDSVEQGPRDIVARLGALQGTYDRAAPLLGQGFQERGAQQAGRVSLIGQQLHADNDMARSNYVSGREAEDRSRSFQQEQAETSNRIALESLAQEAQLERERIAATANENLLNRNMQSDQFLLDLLHAGFMLNPETGAIEPVPTPAPTAPAPAAPRIGSPRNRN